MVDIVTIVLSVISLSATIVLGTHIIIRSNCFGYNITVETHPNARDIIEIDVNEQKVLEVEIDNNNLQQNNEHP